MALFQKIGGLKILVPKKGNQIYVAVAIAITLALCAASGYSIWYSVNVLGMLFTPEYRAEQKLTTFDLARAARLEKLQDGYWENQTYVPAGQSPVPSPTPAR